MKTAFIAFLIFLLSTPYLIGQYRYSQAITATKGCTGTDSAITQTLRLYGFQLDIFEEPGFVDFYQAGLNSLN